MLVGVGVEVLMHVGRCGSGCIYVSVRECGSAYMHVGRCESACIYVSVRVHAWMHAGRCESACIYICQWARSADPADVFDVGESHDLEVHTSVCRDWLGCTRAYVGMGLLANYAHTNIIHVHMCVCCRVRQIDTKEPSLRTHER